LGAKLEILILLFPLGCLAVLVSIVLFEDLLHSLFHMILRVFYRIEIRGMHNFPEREGALIVSNHLSYADPVFIGAAFPRKVRYLAHEELSSSRLMNAVFRLTDTLTVSTTNSLASVKQSVKRLVAGTPLCLFAEGGISRIGITLSFMRGSILLAKSAKVPIIPTFLDGVWGSIFSNQGGCFFKKLPQSFPYRVSVWVGHPIQPEKATPESIRQAVLQLGRESFNEKLGNTEEMSRNLRNKIFHSSPGILFKDRNGCVISRSQFLGKINSSRELSEPYGEWIRKVQDVLNQREESVILPWVNWMRLKQTNLIDHPKLRICRGDQTWLDQWFPWFPLLSGFGFEQNEDGSWQTITKDKGTECHRVDGLVTPQNGLVALQLPNELSGDNIQQGNRNGAWGRMLPGFAYSSKDGEFVLNGMKEPEILPQVSLDKDGFLIRKGN